MKDIGRKGQGAVGFWITALVGIVVVITMYIVFDYVLYDTSVGLAPHLATMGLNTSSQTMVALHTSWNFWPLAFVGAWILALIVRSIIKDPDWGY
jgi:hypothetical protein